MSPDSLKERTQLTIAFCGGGSGGHLTPAIALARAWVSENPRIQFRFLFLCSGRIIDQTVLSKANLHNCDVQIVAQTVTTSSQKLRLINCLRRDFFTSQRMLKQSRPDVIFGMGGFASVAPVLAAYRLGKRPVLLELNAVPGRATRWLSRVSNAIWSGWPMPQHLKQLNQAAIFPFGVPVPPATTGPKPSESTKQQLRSRTLIIAGGSLGAARLNDIVCDALADHSDRLREWKIEHQTGPNWQPSSSQIKACQGLNWSRHRFIPNLAQQFATADIVISRAGAVTLAEIAQAKVPSILVPLSQAADNHQAANTKSFEDANAAFVVDEAQPTASAVLSSCLKQLLSDEAKREQMKGCCQKLQGYLACQNASEKLAALLPNS
ncbi:MAG: UDP-N-acetylglucosamine--N-acetylmuramyl-(pentapeptide) pyrophosphoryl-undecaprenol N-acetylglucosamine transferase [Fuerstiella sp.]